MQELGGKDRLQLSLPQACCPPSLAACTALSACFAHLLTNVLGAGEITQWAKSLLCNNEDPSSDPRISPPPRHTVKPGTVVCTRHFKAAGRTGGGGGGTGESLKFTDSRAWHAHQCTREPVPNNVEDEDRHTGCPLTSTGTCLLSQSHMHTRSFQSCKRWSSNQNISSEHCYRLYCC